ncbi:S-adenosyl-L-methionine-dependent methyltransferase [Schizophyllum commune]
MSDQRSPLRALVDTLSQAVTVIDEAFAAAKQPYPPLAAPFDPASPAEALFQRIEVAQAAKTIQLATSALSASVGTPAIKTINTAFAHTSSAALHVAVDGAVAEILRSNEKGLHVNDIAAQNGLDPGKLGRILRRLASVHIFREVSPNVFANNRLSSTLDTTKSVKDILSSPTAHFEAPGNTGVAALARHLSEVTLKGSAYIYETLVDEEYGKSEAPEKAPVPYAFKTPFATYEWYEQPGNEGRLACFSAAMTGGAASQRPDAIVEGFDFSKIAPGSKVVDVGGGMGHIVMSVTKKYPELVAVVEDRPAVVEQAKDFWSKQLPNARVEFVGQDFFKPQAIKEAGAYILCHILHNWGQTQAVKILRNLRDAAGSQTRLIVGEQIAPYACSEQPPAASDIKGSDTLLPPIDPLLAPARAELPSSGDIVMYLDLNGEERTLGGFADLLLAGGWKVVEVHHFAGNLDAHIVAEPV